MHCGVLCMYDNVYVVSQGERVWGHSHSKVVQEKIRQLKWLKWLLTTPPFDLQWAGHLLIASLT